MRLLLLFILLGFLTLTTKAQITMKPLNDKIIYLGVENPVVFLNGVDSLCNDTLKVSNNIRIRKDSYSCFYWLKPINSNTTTFVEIRKQKIDLSQKLEKIPNPTWVLNNSKSEVSLERLKSTFNFSFWLTDFDFEATLNVISYDVKVYRDSLLNYVEKVDGRRFSHEFKSFIQNNDEVVFSNIIIKFPEEIRKIDDIKFRVIQEKKDGFFKRLINKIFKKK